MLKVFSYMRPPTELSKIEPASAESAASHQILGINLKFKDPYIQSGHASVHNPINTGNIKLFRASSELDAVDPRKMHKS